MIAIQAEMLHEVLDYPSLVEAMREIILSEAEAPDRHHHTIPVPGSLDATLLLMPAWQTGEYGGVKVATIFPSNSDSGIPSVMASYLLLDGKTGELLASMDGKLLTSMRTAAISALASSWLSRSDAKTLSMVGAGTLAAPLIRAHSVVRPIDTVFVWNRSEARAETVISELKSEGIDARFSSNLEASVRQSDIVVCATLSTTPLVFGNWVKKGTHINLVGAYTAAMRESDAGLISKSRVFVDSLSGTKSEAGDLIQAQAEGAWSFDRIAGDLRDLVSGEVPGRTDAAEITLFKSVGSALQDLAAARLAYTRLRRESE